VNLTGLFDPKKFTLSDGRRGRKQQIADLTVFELYKLAYAYCTFIGGQEIYDDDVNVGRKKEIEKYLLSSEQLLMESCKSVEKDYLKQLTETQLRVLMEEISYIDNEYDGIDGCFERIYASKDEENNTSSSTVKFLDINSAMRNWRERNAVRQLYRTQTSKMLNSSNNVLSITQSVVQVIPRLFIMNIALTIDFRDKSWTQAGIAAIGGLVRSVVDFASVATSASSLVATTATVYIEYFKILVFVAESLGVVIDQVRMYPYCLEEKISSIYRNRLKELSSKEHVFDDWKTIFPDLLSKFKDREKQNHCLSIMKCIDANFQMRKLLSKDFTLGVVGHGKNGKSTILKNMFGFNTNPDKEIRTEDLHSYRVNDEFRVVDFPHMTSVFDYVTNCFTCNHTPVNAVIVVLNAELSGNDIICEEYVVNKVKHLAKKGVHVLFCFNQCDKLALKKGSRQISGNIDECSEYGSDEIQQIDTSTENDVCEYWTEEYVEKKRKEWAKNYQIDLNKCWMTFCDLEETNTAKLKENYNRLKSIKLRTYLDIKEMWLKGVLKDNSLSENSINEIMNFRYGKQQ
jgi:GTP-binding protein EngB required for normal cell division